MNIFAACMNIYLYTCQLLVIFIYAFKLMVINKSLFNPHVVFPHIQEERKAFNYKTGVCTENIQLSFND